MNKQLQDYKAGMREHTLMHGLARNLAEDEAPCISCHGGVDQKLGTPWFEVMPKGVRWQGARRRRTGAVANAVVAAI